MTQFDISKDYNKYAQDVVDGKTIANKYIRLACQRYIDWFSRDDYYFDYEDVDRKIRFVGRMRHVKGDFVGKPFILYDWQQWIFAATFGWKHVSTGKRVTKKLLLFISRKNGKSSLAAALSLCMLVCDNEAGAEVSVLANTGKQANELFEKISDYAETLDPKQKVFSRYRSSIKVPVTKSQVIVHSADKSSLDGYNTSCALIDEYHAQANTKLYDVMVSSMAMRSQPLIIVLTTAGFLVGDEFPLYNMWETCKDILDGYKTDDTQFAAIYQLDDGDDWRNKLNWTKCSPGYPAIIRDDFMNEQILSASNSPQLEVGVKTKTFNMFCQSESVWIPSDTIKKYSQPIDFEQFTADPNYEYYCYAGVDLAYVDDFTAVSFMIKMDKKYYFKTFLYVPELIVNKSKNRILYDKWIKEGYMKVLPDKERMTYDILVKDILEVNEKLKIMELAYDTRNAPEFTRSMIDNGIIATSFGQTKGNFNMATKAFESRLFNGEVIIDDNPAVRWCFANATLKIDPEFNNVKPIKGAGRANKIDAVISMLEALGIYLLREESFVGISVIETEY